MVNIVVVDDHQMMRQGLCALIKEQPDFQVLGDAGNGEEGLKLVESLHPDVIVLDMAMPGLNGVEVARRVVQKSPKCAIVILSMYAAEGYVREAIAAGAKAYVLKQDSAEELVRAIREAIAGRHYISRRLTQKAISSYAGVSSQPGELYQTLTAREREVLQLVAEANTSVKIAAKLFISPRTVEFHRANIMRKLGIDTQQELMRYCLEQGISPPPSKEVD